MSKGKVVKLSETSGVFRLEGNKLGRPYHRLPSSFIRYFDVIDARLNSYFLKKYRVNATLGKLSFEMDTEYKQAEMLLTPLGHLGVEIDPVLIGCILNDYYGLSRNQQADTPISSEKDLRTLSRTEERLKSRLAVDIAEIVLHEEILGEKITIKNDPSAINSQWSYKISFNLNGYPEGKFHLYLDHHHADRGLAIIRKMGHDSKSTNFEYKSEFSFRALIETLPLTLNARVAQTQMRVAQLANIRSGDILPIYLPSKFPIFIGKNPIFNATIAENHGKLLLTDIAEYTAETLVYD
jgi:flagellar motor switch protein FliM